MPDHLTDAFEAERPRLVGFASRVLGDHAEAEDALADSVGVALQVVLDRLSPRERVASVLHDTVGFDFATIGAILEATPTTAREGDFDRLLALLASSAAVSADADAVAMGTPEESTGRDDVAEFFNGSAHSALPVEYPAPRGISAARPRCLRLHRGRRTGPCDPLPGRPGGAGRGGTTMTRSRSGGSVRRTPDGISRDSCTRKGTDDVINAQDQHLKDVEKAGDAMKGRWKHPVRSMGWYNDTKKTFAALPDDLVRSRS